MIEKNPCANYKIVLVTAIYQPNNEDGSELQPYEAKEIWILHDLQTGEREENIATKESLHR